MNETIKYLLTDPKHLELTEEEIKLLMSSGFVFGSYVYGDPRTAEDFDIAVYSTDPGTFDQFIGSKLIYEPGHYWEEHFRCFYGVYKGKIINVLVFDNKEWYDKYQQVTEIMKSLKKSTTLMSNMLNEKKFRVETFEYFLNRI